MGERDDRRIQCDGKDKIPTMKLAKEVASRMARRRKSCMSSYKCPHCGYYHVGELIKSRPGKKFVGKPQLKFIERK